jgi:hypothetical protein
MAVVDKETSTARLKSLSLSFGGEGG